MILRFAMRNKEGRNKTQLIFFPKKFNVKLWKKRIISL